MIVWYNKTTRTATSMATLQFKLCVATSAVSFKALGSVQTGDLSRPSPPSPSSDASSNAPRDASATVALRLRTQPLQPRAQSAATIPGRRFLPLTQPYQRAEVAAESNAGESQRGGGGGGDGQRERDREREKVTMFGSENWTYFQRGPRTTQSEQDDGSAPAGGLRSR